MWKYAEQFLILSNAPPLPFKIHTKSEPKQILRPKSHLCAIFSWCPFFLASVLSFAAINLFFLKLSFDESFAQTTSPTLAFLMSFHLLLIYFYFTVYYTALTKSSEAISGINGIFTLEHQLQKCKLLHE
jgi:hypothetical protein